MVATVCILVSNRGVAKVGKELRFRYNIAENSSCSTHSNTEQYAGHN